MNTTVRAALGTCAIALFAGCQSGAPSTPPPAQPVEAAPPEAEPTTADGIFTAAQAARGEALFDGTCSECHDTADWTEPGFQGRWEDQSVFQLWYYIAERMPYDEPFTLTRQQTTDVLAYILQLNGLPEGDAELATDDDSIDDYWIVWDTPR